MFLENPILNLRYGVGKATFCNDQLLIGLEIMQYLLVKNPLHRKACVMD